MQLFREKLERRRWQRHWLNAPIRVFTDSTVIDGRGIRLSEGGIYLFALANMTPGEQIRIEYAAPPSGQSLSRSGVVRNRAIYLYGIEFSEPQTEHTKLSLQALNSLPAGSFSQLQSSRED
ncbi:MAG TPA: PilZ domain-containing protein [Terriglobales bacterium]|nr:PilZ domain-containing protein [Terriglobales bacterium]